MPEALLAFVTSAAFALFAIVAPIPARYVLGHVSISFALLGVAYAFRAPAIIGKQPNGSLHPMAWLLLLPLHLFNLAATRLLVLGVPATSQVLPNVFLGRRLTPGEARELVELHPRLVVIDLAAELPERRALRRQRYFSFPVLDRGVPNEPVLFEALARISRYERQQRPLLVHCAAGNGRSAALLAAHLICTGRARNASAALAFIRRSRPGARFSRAQRKVLGQFTERYTTLP